MARGKATSRGLFGWIFGRKKKRTSKKKKTYWRYIWMFLAFVTGSGGVAGVTEYEVVRNLWSIVWDRIEQRAVLPGDGDAPQSGDIRVYFTRPGQPPQAGDPAHTLAGYVDETKQTLDICAFELDNQVITDAIVRAVRRGVQVRLVSETNYIDESGVKALRAAGVPVIDDARDGALMHNKFMIFDRKAVWTGSMNLTENCAYRNDNHGVYLENAQLVENYETKFRWMFERRKFGGVPSRGDRIPNPVVKFTDGTLIENYFSTHDRPAAHVVEAIRMAKKSIHFLAFSFTHDEIGQAMLERARNGVEVAGVFEKSQAVTDYSEYARLRSARLPVYLDANPRNMHHKVIIIDNEIVLAGSFNFSESADKTNDENLLIIYNRSIAARFEDEFQRVYGLARSADGR